MPREQVTEAIKGVTYTFMFLSSSEAIKTAAQVAKRIMPSIGKIIPKSGKLSSILEMELSDLNLDDAFSSFAQGLDPDETVALVQKLCSVVMADGKPIAFDEHFKGDVALALQVAKKSFSVNCGDFFADALAALGLKKTKA